MPKDPVVTRSAQALAWFKSVQALAEGVAKAVIIVGMLGSMVIFAFLADPANKGHAVPFSDRILVWSFVVFAVGLAELFALFVVLAVLGKVDLPSAFYEKDPDVSVSEEAATIDATRSAEAGSSTSNDEERSASAQERVENLAAESSEGGTTGKETASATMTSSLRGPDKAPPAEAASVHQATKVEVQVKRRTRPKPASPAVSLSRLQAFMWTLVVMTIYFHRVVKDGENSLPTIPAELLMVMGISGATYLISKNIASSAAAKKGANATAPEGSKVA